MKVTVAICTWNRAKLLDQTLTQMHALRIPADVEWELLVVNNNCTDETDAIIAQHESTLPVRRLFEPNPGLSNARNCALSKAQGDLILWTDDDVLVEPGWLAGYVEASQCWPNAGFFGGPIGPWFEIQPPDWVASNLERLAGMLVIVDFGPVERELAGNEVLFGANMGFRTNILNKFRFDPNLGRSGSQCTHGDETDILNILKHQGISGVWVPAARMGHFVQKERLSRKYLRRWHYGLGRTDVRMGQFSEPTATFVGAPRWLFRRALEAGIRSCSKNIWSRTRWVSDEAEAAYFIGAIMECRRLARNPLGCNANVNSSPIAPSCSSGKVDTYAYIASSKTLGM